jgi:hypothetical protein
MLSGSARDSDAESLPVTHSPYFIAAVVGDERETVRGDEQTNGRPQTSFEFSSGQPARDEILVAVPDQLCRS